MNRAATHLHALEARLMQAQHLAREERWARVRGLWSEEVRAEQMNEAFRTTDTFLRKCGRYLRRLHHAGWLTRKERKHLMSVFVLATDDARNGERAWHPWLPRRNAHVQELRRTWWAVSWRAWWRWLQRGPTSQGTEPNSEAA
jgi:hypothetical protein